MLPQNKVFGRKNTVTQKHESIKMRHIYVGFLTNWVTICCECSLCLTGFMKRDLSAGIVAMYKECVLKLT